MEGGIGGIKGIDILTRLLMHGVSQGAISKAGGGRFGDGALGAFASSIDCPAIGRAGSSVRQAITAAEGEGAEASNSIMAVHATRNRGGRCRSFDFDYGSARDSKSKLRHLPANMARQCR